MSVSTVETALDCRHCGTLFHPRNETEVFCCTGCAFVHGLIQDRGLDKFYDLRDRPVAPVQANLLQQRDDSWLDKVAEQAREDSDPEPMVRFDLQGISCVGCVWLIEKLFEEQPGALHIDIHAQLGTVRLRVRAETFDFHKFAAELRNFGYILGPPGTRRSGEESDRLLTRVGVCATLALNTMLFTLPGYLGMEEDFAYAGLFRLLTLLFATLSFAVGGSYFIKRAWEGTRRGVIHIDLPIALGVSAAYAGSFLGWLWGEERFVYFDFVAVFTFLMLIGRWVQEVVLERNRNQLLGLNPHTERVERRKSADGSPPGEVSARELRPGDLFAVPPGRAVPVGGRVRLPEASLSLEWISGEAEARTFRFGDALPSGAINLGAVPLLCEAEEGWEDSLLGKLVDSSLEGTRFSGLERLLKWYIAIVVVVAAAGYLWWGLAAGDWVAALQVLISVLVVSCPCALGVAYPLTNEMATVRLRRVGLFVRNDTVWARIKRLRRIVFDKTGTLTLENPVLANPEALDALATEERRMLWRMVRNSLHPVSRSLREALLADPEIRREVGGGTAEELPGRGLRLQEDGVEWRMGRPEWADPERQADGSDAVFARGGEVLAALRFTEAPRPGAVEDIGFFRRMGMRLFILSGDRSGKVGSMLRALGMREDEGCGELSPDEKAAWLRRNAPEETLFVGDGANDSLAFNVAACTGTPVADSPLLRDKADFYFVGRSLRALRALFRVSVLRHRAARTVFLFAIAYNIAVVLVALAGKMHPLLAAILMPLSSLATLAIVRWIFGRIRADG